MAAAELGSGDPTYYALRPQTPVRAWVIAGLALVAGGAALLAGWPEPRKLVLVVIGALVGVAGLALAITAAVLQMDLHTMALGIIQKTVRQAEKGFEALTEKQI